jgi:hypothetical protein
VTDELPEWPADAPADGEEPIDTETPIMDRLADMLHRAFNDKPSDIGPQVITKWIVVAEVQGVEREEPTLRWVDSDLASWTIKGMLQEVADDLIERRLLYSIASIVDDEDDDA